MTRELTAEWPLFKSITFKKCLLYHSKVDKDISRTHLENVQELIKKRESYTPQKLWDNLKHNNLVKEICHNCIYLLHLPLFSLSAYLVWIVCFHKWGLWKRGFVTTEANNLGLPDACGHRITTLWFYRWRFRSFCQWT